MGEFLFQFQVQGYLLVMILWNIFLAVIPCVIVWRLLHGMKQRPWSKLKGHRTAIIILFLVWFFFFPNTAYLFTVIRHLVDYCSHYNFYRVCSEGEWRVLFFYAYSFLGVPTYYYSLKGMSRVFDHLFGRLPALLLPIIMIPLTSIGLMFGLFERFNSWDIVTRPHQLFITVGTYFTEPYRLVDFIGFTIVLYFIYYLTAFLLRKND